MKRLLLILSIFYITTCVASSNNSKVRTVRVGYFQMEGYQEIDEKGKKTGYGYEFLAMLQRYANLRFEYVGQDSSWNAMEQMLRRGEIDMLTSAHKTRERQQHFLFSEPIGENAIEFTVRENDDRYAPHEYGTFEGMRVGLVKGSSVNERMKNFANRNHFSYVPVYYDDTKQLKHDLTNGLIDAICTSSLRKMYHEKRLARFDPQYFYVMMQQGDSSLLKQINHGIQQLNQNDPEWTSHLYYRNYINSSSAINDFTDEEKAFIMAHSSFGTPITVALDNNWSPFSERQGNQFVGIIPDFWKEVHNMTGMQFEFYGSEKDAFPFEVITEGKADVYLGATDEPQVAEQKGLLASTTFLSVGGSLLYMKGKAEIRTVALSNTTNILNEKFQNNEKWNVLHYRSSAEALEALTEGKVDAIYCYTYDAIKMINDDSYGVLAMRIMPGVTINLRAVTSLDKDHILMSIITKCIRRLSGENTEEIISHNLSYKAERMSVKDWIFSHPLLSLTLSILILVLVVIIVELGFRLRIHKNINRKSRQLNRKLEEANKSKTNFLFNMSHDIRTPMNAIIGFADLIEKHKDNPTDVSEYVTKIKSSGKFLLSLINNVLDMARIESGKAELDENFYDIYATENNATMLFADMAKKKNITLTSTAHVDHQYVMCDATKTRQILINLVSNAIKYTPEGGAVTVTFSEIPCQREGYGRYMLIVADNGIGMSPEFAENVFEMFSRERNTTQSKVKGTGLGMSIVKKLVDLMGGTILIDTAPGKGTTITITIEIRIVQNAEGHLKQQQEEQTLTSTSLEGKRILLAEDNDLNAEIAQAILEELGVLTERAVDGVECIDKLIAVQPGYYDAILMDIQMPNLNGYGASQRIRSLDDSEKARIPIIAMTANAFEEDKRDALNAGMNGHLAKPIDVPELVRILSQTIK